MEKKKVSMSTFLIIVGIIVIGVLSCYLVVLTQQKVSAEQNVSKLEEDVKTLQATLENNQKEKEQLQEKINVIANAITTENTVSQNTTVAEQQDEGIKVEKDEFSLILPNSWEGKYEIRVSHEETDVTRYTFLSTANTKLGADGTLFEISVHPLDLGYRDLEYIPELYLVKVGNGNYIMVYGPSDVRFSDNKEAMEEYQSMQEDIESILNTIMMK